jgi:hypothetical protein
MQVKRLVLGFHVMGLKTNQPRTGKRCAREVDCGQKFEIGRFTSANQLNLLKTGRI